MTVGAANVGKNIVMILDNFPSHKAKIARQYAEDFGINLVYLPPYSPDLNPIEFIWKSIKREVSCEFIRDVDHLKNLIKENFYKFSARRSFATNWIKVFLGNELSVISWVNDYNLFQTARDYERMGIVTWFGKKIIACAYFPLNQKSFSSFKANVETSNKGSLGMKDPSKPSPQYIIDGIATIYINRTSSLV